MHFKQFQEIGDHEILDRWCDAVSDDLMDLLDSSGHDWSAFFPIRVGKTEAFSCKLGEGAWDSGSGGQDSEYYPVVLLVAIADDEMAWEPAIKLALSSRNVLERAKIRDVEVEVLESEATLLGFSRPDMESVVDDKHWDGRTAEDEGNKINKTILPVLTHLGHRVRGVDANNKSITTEGGSMALHLRLGSDQNKI